MRYFILLTGVCISCFVHAQTTFKYAGNITGGLLAGSKPYSGFINLEQGVAYGQYRFGMGCGYDFYRIRSIPLYATASRFFTHKSTRPFVKIAAGLNIVSPTNIEKDRSFYYGYGGYFHNGIYAKGGGGVTFRADKKWQLSLLAGYNLKSTTYNYHSLFQQSWPTATKPIEDKYSLKRWYIGAGISW